MEDKSGVEAYLKLRETIDAKCEQLNNQHVKELSCKKGCDSCCESINVFPIEFEAIKTEMASTLRLIKNRPFNRFRKSCVFLVEGACSIYQSRPIICRTQGLPLLYQNAEGTAYELSVCHLNFKGINPGKFNMDNALYMPEYNSRLYLLNKDFVSKTKYSEKQRIPLYKLLKK